MNEGQLNIYNMLGLSNDPVFTLIEQLRINDEIQIENLTVKKTIKFYEIENDDLHELFGDKEKCYTFIDKYINKIPSGIA